MGGCRCYFRNCKVNTNKNPLMHFFRFPIKDEARYKKWREYSKRQQIVEYAASKQKNCVLCSRHFRDECFMNYKKDRLTATAVPTIHRLAQDKALDYELNMEDGVLVTLPTPQHAHLIPPPDFECPLGMEADEALWTMLKNVENRSCAVSEVKASTNKFLIGVVDEDVGNTSSGLVHMSQTTENDKAHSSQKRPLGEENHDLAHSSNKKIKTLNHIQQLPTSADAQHISLSEATTLVFDHIETNSPTIINHHIIEADADMWIEQESYNIADDGTGYELVEIQSSSGQHIAPVECEKSSEEESVPEVPLGDLCNSEQCHANLLEMENTNIELMEENKTLDKKLLTSQDENSRIEKEMLILKSEVEALRKENETLKTQLQKSQTSRKEENTLKEKYEQQLQIEQTKHAEIETSLQQQISTLEHSLDLVRQQLLNTKNNLSIAKKDYASVQSDKMNLIKQQVESDHISQNLQEKIDNLNVKHSILQKNHESLQKEHAKLKKDYTKLESQQNQVSTVTTSNNSADATPAVSVQQAQLAGTLTKAQLFNGIKRYVSSSMVALLRMEMFGSSDREWKPDERQVATDLLRLGETVYKYFTDEWRFRLPGLRDVRNWLSQAVDMNDEEDL